MGTDPYEDSKTKAEIPIHPDYFILPRGYVKLDDGVIVRASSVSAITRKYESEIASSIGRITYRLYYDVSVYLEGKNDPIHTTLFRINNSIDSKLYYDRDEDAKYAAMDYEDELWTKILSNTMRE